MAGPTSVREEAEVIRIYRPASDETLTIVVEHVHHDAAPRAHRRGPARARGAGARAARAPRARSAPDRGRARGGRARAPHRRRPRRPLVPDAEDASRWSRSRRAATAAAIEQVVRYREQAPRKALGEFRASSSPRFPPRASCWRGRATSSASARRARLLFGAGPDDLHAVLLASAWSDSDATGPGMSRVHAARRTPRAPCEGRRPLAHVEVRQHEPLATGLAGDAARLAGGQVDCGAGSAVASVSSRSAPAACSPSAGVTAVSPE